MLGRLPLEVNLLELPPLLDTVLGLNLLKLGLWVVVVACALETRDRVRVLRLLEPNRDLLRESPLEDNPVFCLTNLRLLELFLLLILELVEGLLEAVDELL